MAQQISSSFIIGEYNKIKMFLIYHYNIITVSMSKTVLRMFWKHILAHITSYIGVLKQHKHFPDFRDSLEGKERNPTNSGGILYTMYEKGPKRSTSVKSKPETVHSNNKQK